MISNQTKSKKLTSMIDAALVVHTTYYSNNHRPDAGEQSPTIISFNQLCNYLTHQLLPKLHSQIQIKYMQDKPTQSQSPCEDKMKKKNYDRGEANDRRL